MARMELEIKYNKSINREPRMLGVSDNLYYISNEMEQYKGFEISEIDPIRGTVTFSNGTVIQKGDVVGDISEKDMRRIQIRETIISHIEKEEKLFNMGIKTLSLFFIDGVAKYRQYDDEGNEKLGEYGEIFEQEYSSVLNDFVTIFDTPYQKYLKKHCGDVSLVHRGYFSIDKKTGRSVDSAIIRGSVFSDDISAYDLIQQEYCISDGDYKNIVNIIHNACAAMESTSRTFSKNNEEELRDFIIATLGTHYINSVSGETFRKIGKTDIHVMFDNKAAFIGECKIWHGIKKFNDAIEQLFGYSTWKDTKTALIVFNKENKDFSAIRKSVKTWIESNAKRYEIMNSNIWSCILHRDDTNTDVRVAIALYDLAV